MIQKSHSLLPRTLPRLSCPICSVSGSVLHHAVTDRAHGIPGEWSIRTCATCRIGWLDPQPIDDDIALCYPAIYYTHQKAGPQDASTARADQPVFGVPGWKGRLRDAILAGRYGYEPPGTDGLTRRLGWLLGLIGPVRYRVVYSDDHSLPAWRRDGRLLDIGCGAGNYLRLARSLGWQTYGLEPDPVAAALARETGAIVELGTLDTATLADAPFDAVTSMHSIEHARDPRSFLRKALALLKPGGVFYLQTPNFASLMHRRYGADWYALEVPRHLCLLTAPAMRQLLAEAGPWEKLTVRTNARRAVREQEQTLAMRREGSFEKSTPLSWRDRVGVTAWAWIESAGNGTMDWGEELEVIGVKGR